jgi:hypothetical protein
LISIYHPPCSLWHLQQEEFGKWALTGNYDVLVPPASATDSLSSHQGYHVLSVKQNHSDMVKFSSQWDENYQVVKDYLKQFSVVAVEVIRKRFLKTQGQVQLSKTSLEAGVWRLRDNLY